jgi:hypothetical protein
MTDSTKYHAYTDGTDTIIGTSLHEAIEAYSKENPDADSWGDTAGMWETIDDEAEDKTARGWIDLHISESPDNFSRLLCSTEY